VAMIATTLIGENVTSCCCIGGGYKM
jgi:hypothetical protein